MTYRLSDFGSYTAGGRTHEVTEGTPTAVQFTRMTESLVDPRGHFAVEHAYVQYFVPEERRPGPPVLLVHGGGLSGSCWDTTADGRPGWLQLLLADGYEVHVLDNAERGRSGFAPGLWEGDPILRSLEEAWTLFRIGSPEGFASRTPYPGQLFPVEAMEAFARTFVPRWLTTTPILTDAMVAVLRRLKRALVICHSQGGEITFDAYNLAPECFDGIIAIEPSGLPDNPTDLRSLPCVLATGDFLTIDRRWRERSDCWLDFVSDLERISAPIRHLTSENTFGPGNSHMLMTDTNSADVLRACLTAWNGVCKSTAHS